MDELGSPDLGKQKRLGLIAAAVTFVCVVLLGVVVYFSLDRVQYKKIPHLDATELPEGPKSGDNNSQVR